MCRWQANLNFDPESIDCNFKVTDPSSSAVLKIDQKYFKALIFALGQEELQKTNSPKQRMPSKSRTQSHTH